MGLPPCRAGTSMGAMKHPGSRFLGGADGQGQGQGQATVSRILSSRHLPQSSWGSSAPSTDSTEGLPGFFFQFPWKSCRSFFFFSFLFKISQEELQTPSHPSSHAARFRGSEVKLSDCARYCALFLLGTGSQGGASRGRKGGSEVSGTDDEDMTYLMVLFLRTHSK